MAFEGRHMIRILPARFQSMAVRRAGRRLRTLISKDVDLMKDLKEAEDAGTITINKFKKDMGRILKDVAKERKLLRKVGRKNIILQLDETERLGKVNEMLDRAFKATRRIELKQAIRSVDDMIGKMEDVEKTLMAKFDKLKNDDTVWVRVMEMDIGSVTNEVMSLGTIAGRLISRVKGLEKRVKSMSAKAAKEKITAKIDDDINNIKTMIEELHGMLDKEIKYLSEEGKDEILCIIFEGGTLKSVKERTTQAVKKGLPEDLAESIIKKADKIIEDEEGDEREFVNEERIAMSVAERQKR